ncbi:class I SAM-dependent methyltransferase [Ancylobacter dichloromethanicus]|uniref:class I SAM-dependent methyltransferase n=2 Tax=Ancylobacter dichloromethanicus TaxID=518825 RepID=UPI0022F2F9A8|nr:class I SAM-dependent methyltransferase [Ancylobacter dichloromethanicus]
MTRLIRQNKGKDMSPIFDHIYENNLWRSDESRSGPGSTLAGTANIRQELPKIVENLSLTSILDAPCGDFYWMKEVTFRDGFRYIGADIVKPMIEANRQAYEKPFSRTFLTLDITKDPLPEVGLFFCRDCLFHLSIADIKKVFDNFLRSGTPYMMTTTHINTDQFVNTDINSGSFRFIDLFKPPFNLPADVLARVDDYHMGIVPREMCVWSREQIAQARGS